MTFRKIYNKIRYFIYKRLLSDCDHLIIKKEYIVLIFLHLQ